MRIGVVIPTYNEAENLPRLIPNLLGLPLDLHLLVVDDNSPDGTGCLADKLSVANAGKLSVLHRPEKSGLASACLQGFQYFLDKRVEAIAQIDADLSHDPKVMIAMAKRLESCDLALGSRYIPGGSVDKHWSFKRKNLSFWGNVYARHILGLPFQDVTTGYRLWRSEALRGIPLNHIRSRGYVFQVETAYLAHRLDYCIAEVPIHFAERKNGKTKMSFRIQVEAALRVWQMLWTYREVHRSDQAMGFKGTF
jgi:dolichol-phosphate mannosyltransferase